MAKKILKKYWLIIVFLLVFLLRLPSLFEPFTYGDEGIYLTLGQALRRGLVWYRDIHDNKPPMLYLMAAIAGRFSTYRLIHFIWSFVTIFMFLKLARLVFPKNQTAIAISTSVFALLGSTHTFEGNVANAENFMLILTILAFYLVLKLILADKKTLADSWMWLWTGLLLGLATLFKVPAAFDLGAIVVLLFLIFFEQKKKNYSLYAIRYTLLTLGFLSPILLTIIYYAFMGGLSPYLKAAFFQNIPYLSSWGDSLPQTGGVPLGMLIRGLLIAGLITVLFIFRKRVSLTIKLILLWFGFSLFAALLSSRPYPHYLIQILPPLSLSFGLFAVKTKKKFSLEKIIPVIFLFISLTVFLLFNFWYYENLPYYVNFYSYLLRLKDRNEYFTQFDHHALDLYQAAKYIITHTEKGERIFVWGTRSSIYALADRSPVGRYAASYHIIDFDGYEETIEALKQNPPRYIIVTGEEKRPFPALTTLLQTNYALEKKFGNIQIFHQLIQSF